ncbi:MAG: DUF5666 domain-containing protein [Planctomycetota bacterium]
MVHRILILALVAFGLAGALVAQQSNSAGASLVANNQEGVGMAITADIESPGLALLRVSGEPGRAFALVTGTFAPGWVGLPGVGTFDLNTGLPLTLLMDGLSPRGELDWFAKTRADSGEALVAANMPAGLSGFGPGFQAIVVDPAAPLGISFTAATRFNFVSQGGGLLGIQPLGVGSTPPPPPVSASGMAGSTGNILAEVRAPIDALGTADLTILGNVLVQIVAGTNVRDLSGASLPFSSLAVGDFVKVEAFVDAATGVLTAHQVRLDTPRPGYDVKVEAALDAIGANDVTLLGVNFALTPSTDVDVAGGIAALSVGDAVEVKADLTPTGYEVVEIHEANLVFGAFNVSYRSRSFVDAVDAANDTIMVLGQTIYVGSGTRFDNVSGLAGLSSSSYVEVRANPDPAGQLWASRIKVRSPDTEVRVEGPVDNLVSPDFTIWGVAVSTTAGTQWQNGLTGFGDLTVGARVQAKGFLIGGVIVADEVELDPQDD